MRVIIKVSDINVELPDDFNLEVNFWEELQSKLIADLQAYHDAGEVHPSFIGADGDELFRHRMNLLFRGVK